MGRRTILTSEMMDEIFTQMRSGVSKRLAARAVGISETAFFEWVTKGEAAIEAERRTGVMPESKKAYAAFARGVKKAETDFRLTHLRNIKHHSLDDWKASAWMLERCYPDDYGRKFVDLEVSGKKDGEPIKTESVVQIYLPDNGRDKDK